jgi:SPP1 gp7 family putative phage head morphogenesis protein
MVSKSSFAGEYVARDIRHQVYLQRYNTGVIRRMLALMNRNDAALLRRIAELPAGSSITKRLEKQLESLAETQAELATTMQEQMTREMGVVAAYEAQFTRDNVSAAFGVQWDGPTAGQVRAAALSRPFQGVHLRFAKLDEQMDEFGRRRGALIRDTIRQGFLQGTSVDDVVRQLRGTPSQGYRDGLFEGSRRTTETIVRTAMTHTASAARDEVYSINAELMSGVQWVAVLDARTSSICQDLAGQVFPVDSGPRPPAHPNCRSTTIPVFKGEKAVKVPTYAEWLDGQPASVQRDVLGKSGFEKFKNGDKPNRYIGDGSKTYDIETLKARDDE